MTTGALLLLLLAASDAEGTRSPAAPAAPVPELAVSDSIVVVAERGPATLATVTSAVSVLDREEIERRPADDLAELLASLPGFALYFAEPWASAPPMASARGFFAAGEAEYVQLRVDGVPVYDPESGIADLRRVRAGDVERVEALRGPASALYGDTALGGVIEVFTRRVPATAGQPRESFAGVQRHSRLARLALPAPISACSEGAPRAGGA